MWETFHLALPGTPCETYVTFVFVRDSGSDCAVTSHMTVLERRLDGDVDADRADDALDRLSEALAERLASELDRVLAKRDRPSRLIIRMVNREVFIPIDEIDWIEPERNNVRVHSGPRSFSIRDTLGRIESRLPASTFVRVQRSVIVNAERVEEIHKAGRDFEIVLRGGARLPLGRSYRERLEHVLAAL